VDTFEHSVQPHGCSGSIAVNISYANLLSAPHPLVVLALGVLREALKNRLARMLVVLMLVGLGFALFVKQLAIMESVAIETAFLAALYRLGAVFLLAAFIITSQIRELNDKGLDLLLSLPISRAVFFAGKFLGYSICALLMAMIISLPLFFLAPASQVMAWGMSLALELLIVTAASLFFVLALPHSMGALLSVMGLYLLARTMASLQLMGATSLVDSSGIVRQLTNGALNSIAMLLPRLDLFTQTSWLVNVVGGMAELPALALQTLIYVALLAGAALFDLYRKNF
jgi:ABC-type transport system involved in multi-copper enzyme maturation permease subunit